jgi:hypothetical protein
MALGAKGLDRIAAHRDLDLFFDDDRLLDDLFNLFLDDDRLLDDLFNLFFDDDRLFDDLFDGCGLCTTCGQDPGCSHR